MTTTRWKFGKRYEWRAVECELGRFNGFWAPWKRRENLSLGLNIYERVYERRLKILLIDEFEINNYWDTFCIRRLIHVSINVKSFLVWIFFYLNLLSSLHFCMNFSSSSFCLRYFLQQSIVLLSNAKKRKNSKRGKGKLSIIGKSENPESDKHCESVWEKSIDWFRENPVATYFGPDNMNHLLLPCVFLSLCSGHWPRNRDEHTENEKSLSPPGRLQCKSESGEVWVVVESEKNWNCLKKEKFNMKMYVWGLRSRNEEG